MSQGLCVSHWGLLEAGALGQVRFVARLDELPKNQVHISLGTLSCAHGLALCRWLDAIGVGLWGQTLLNVLHPHSP